MSNLTTTVLFDILRGWPHGGAIDESYPVDPALDPVTLKEGQLVVLDSDGDVTHPASIAAEDSTTPTKLRMVIQGNDQSDGEFLSKVVTLRGNFTVKTEKFIAGSYTPGELVTISTASDTEGYIAQRTGSDEQVVGEVEAYDATVGVLTVSLSI